MQHSLDHRLSVARAGLRPSRALSPIGAKPAMAGERRRAFGPRAGAGFQFVFLVSCPRWLTVCEPPYYPPHRTNHVRPVNSAAAALHSAAILFLRPLSRAYSTAGPRYPTSPRSSPGASTCDARYHQTAAMRLETAPSKYSVGTDRAT